MGEMISDFVNEHKKVKRMIDKTLFKVRVDIYYWFLWFVTKKIDARLG